MILVDTGDIFERSYSVTEAKRPELEARAELYMRSYEKMGYDAISLGDRDVRLVGVELLQKFDKMVKFPILCANLVDTEGKSVFTDSVVIERGGYRIGLFGLITGGAEAREGSIYKVRPAEETAIEMVKKLREQNVEAIVLLAHLNRRDAAALAEKVPGIDVILGGQGESPSKFLESIGTTPTFFAEAGGRGQHMNTVVMHFSVDQYKPFVVRETPTKMLDELRSVDARIQRYAGVINKPAKPGTRSASKDRYIKLIQNLLKERDELAGRIKGLKAVDAEAPFLTLKDVPVPKTLEDDPDVAKWITEFHTKFNGKTMKQPVKRPVRPKAPLTRRGSRVIPKKVLKGAKPLK